MAPSDGSVFSRASVQNKQPGEEAMPGDSTLVPNRVEPRYRDRVPINTKLLIDNTSTVTVANFLIDILPLIIIFVRDVG